MRESLFGCCAHWRVRSERMRMSYAVKTNKQPRRNKANTYSELNVHIADHCVSAVVAPCKLNARTLALYNPCRNGLETCENTCNTQILLSIKAELFS